MEIAFGVGTFQQVLYFDIYMFFHIFALISSVLSSLSLVFDAVAFVGQSFSVASLLIPTCVGVC